MANYYGVCRSNYFDVKDEEKFLEAMSAIPSIKIEKKEKGFVILGDCPDASGWPTSILDEETGEDREFDLPELVSEHLAEESVAIFMESGSEKLRYIVGFAEAINGKGERRYINITQIHDLAKELGTKITEAEY